MSQPITTLSIILWTFVIAILSQEAHTREVELTIQGIAGETSANIEDSTSTSLSGHTLSFPDANIILISDDAGQFRSVVDESATVDLPDGEINYTLIYGNQILQDTLLINEDTPPVIEISTGETDAENDENSNAAATNDENVRRLSTVRVQAETSSDKKVLSADEARRLPGSGGDVLGSLSSLPGVVGGIGFDTSLFIRGGREEDVSYRYDDIIIGSPYHQIFFFSVFPPEIISELIFYPGGYPTEYDNVQGSVVDLVSRDFYDYEDPYNVTISTSIVSASASISFQFLDKFRLTLGGRRSYLEGYIALADGLGLLDALGEFELIPTFYDAHLLFEWQIDPTRDFKFLFLFSGDSFRFNVMNAEFEGATPSERIFIDSSFGFSDIWDSEALIYNSEQAGYAYHSLIYRYSERSAATNQEVESFSLTNEEYSLRQGVDIYLNDLLTLKTYGKVAIDRGYGANRLHPEGEAAPDASDFLTDFSAGMPNGTQLQAFLDAIDAYNEQTEDVNEDFVRGRLSIGTSILYSLQQFRLDAGGIFYADNISQEGIDADFRLRGTYIPPLEDLKLEVFGYAGRYIQYPRAITTNTNTGQAFVQDYALNTPYTYQFGVGTQLTLNNQVEFSLEPYYKLFFDQTIINPTYDSGHPEANGNFPSVNYSEGTATGVDALIRYTGKSWFTGWIAYTWSQALLDQPSIPAEEDRGNVSDDESNNGRDYLNYDRERVPFEQDITHSIKLITQFKLSKRVTLSFRFIANSGLPYSPQVIGVNSTFADPSCTDGIGCDPGYVFVNDPDRINGARLDWALNLDVRLDWFFVKRDKFQASLFIDIFSLHELFYSNPQVPIYDRSAIAANPNINIGDPAPESTREEDTGGTVIPVIGFEFNF